MKQEKSPGERYTDKISRLLTAVPLALAIAAAGACSGKLPDRSSPAYREAVSAFYVGLAALQVGDDPRAETRLTDVTRLAPDEPAAWANLGLLSLRQKEFDLAAQRLEKARSLAPENSSIVALLGSLESARGRSAEAITHLRKAVEMDPTNLKSTYSLAQEIERLGGDNSEAEAQRLLERVLELQPHNLAVLLEVTRLAAKRGDSATLQNSISRIADLSASWPPEAREQLTALQGAASGGADTRAAGTRVAFLRNVLVRIPEYRTGLAAVRLAQGEVGEPFLRFLKMPSPEPTPAAPDESLAFEGSPLPLIDTQGWSWAGHIYLTGEGEPVGIVANGGRVVPVGGAAIGFPGGQVSGPPPANGVLALDFNYDFKTDLVLAGAGGVKLLKQEPPGFTDVTASTSLPASVTTAAYAGAWAADVEMDGDLDIVLGAVEGAPVVLRNNGDGTFKEVRLFEGAERLRGFAWGDIDGDGDPDAGLLGQDGRLLLFANERGGSFRTRALPESLTGVAAVGVADANNDAVFDLLALQSTGAITRVSDKREGREWETAQVASFAGDADSLTAGSARLIVADLDNNGGLDLIAASSTSATVLLGDAQGKLARSSSIEAQVFSVADFTNDGRLDLAAITPGGQAVRFINRGSKDYHWQRIRPRAATATGDQRVNSFGVGGEMEIRSGLLFQKQPITQPVVHFGLGERAETDVVRIVWPNGSVQAEFELQSDQPVLVEQRLKGSCPSLFAYDGEAIRFVKDCPPWSPAIGLRVNAQQTAKITQTEEWIKISGHQLAPKDGFYDLRITAELWETYYNDHYSLMVVDHPEGTEIFVDERTANPPPKLAVHTVASPRPFASALDDRGQDVAAIVRALDSNYLDTFGRGQYQGVTRDHFVELELDESAPAAGPLWLIAHGWMHPTDASINIALSQGSRAPPRGISVEVADGKGGWVTARENLGFPSGKNKIILIPLEGVFGPGAPRRLRLRTNMEIFWDKLEWGVSPPREETKIERLGLAAAELRYRGFSAIERANESSPELPRYDRLATTAQLWRDLIGYYTRFGDIRELLAGVDDRIAIVNAGDEMVLRFAAPPPPPEGWVRDFVLVGNGWIKDGDYNSVFSKTVLPLPARDIPEYTFLPGRLEDDPVYRRHASDWQEYHTRYVTPEGFQTTLRPVR